MRGVPRSEVICSLSYSALFFDHLPTSSSLTLVNPHWNCVCSALQTSLLCLVSGPLSGTHFPSTFLEYLLRWNFSQWCQLWDKFSIKRCLRGLILNTLANNCLFQYAFWWLFVMVLCFEIFNLYEPLLCHYPERECGFAFPLGEAVDKSLDSLR